MLKISKTTKVDQPAILKLLKELDFLCAETSFDNFFTARSDKEIIGFVKFREFEEFFFLSYLGIKEKYQNQGFAAEILEFCLKKAAAKRKAIYIYTIIPEFFEKFGFKTVAPRADLPSKNLFECENCFPDKCVCMVKSPHAA